MQFPASGLASAPGHEAAQRLEGGGRKRAEGFKAGHTAQTEYGSAQNVFKEMQSDKLAYPVAAGNA